MPGEASNPIYLINKELGRLEKDRLAAVLQFVQQQAAEQTEQAKAKTKTAKRSRKKDL